MSDCQTNASGFLKCCLQGLFQDRAKVLPASPFFPAWWKEKPAVWNTVGFDTRELEQVLEAWAGLKEGTDLPSCRWAAGNWKGEWVCPLSCHSPAVFAWFCEVMVVHLLSSASLKTTQVPYLREWAIVGAIFSVFFPGGWGIFCYSGGIYVKIAWQSVFSKWAPKKSSILQTSMCFKVLCHPPL